MNTVNKVRPAIWLSRFVYIAFFIWLVVDFFVLDLNAGVPGLLLLLIGFWLFYLENQLEKLDPKYADTFWCPIWRFLLFPWFLIM